MQDWNHVLMFLYVLILMFIAKLIKEKLGLFKSIVIPTSLLAGFIGLLIGPEVLGQWDFTLFNRTFNLGLHYDTSFYVDVIFYMMILAFVSLTLTNREVKQNRTSIDSGIFIVATYLLQGFLGIATLYLMINTFWPDFFLGLGLLLPLAFGQGTGLASQIGQGWDKATGLDYIMQYGITLATVGFLVGGLFGVIMINYYIRKYNLKPVKLNELKGVKSQRVEFQSLQEVNFFDNLLVQLVWLAIVFLFTYVISRGIYQLLYPLDPSLASVLTSFSYLIGVFIAMGLRSVFRRLERSGHRTRVLIDDYMMQNISSFAMNVMITSAVMSIQIEAIKDYYQVLIALSIVGTIATYFFCEFFGRFVFKGPYENHYIVTMYGMLCGVASTGLALLRGLDPEFKTDTADNVVVLGSAFASVVGFPLMILLGLQIRSYGEPLSNQWNIITFVTLVGYFIILTSVLTLRAKRRRRKSS